MPSLLPAPRQHFFPVMRANAPSALPKFLSSLNIMLGAKRVTRARLLSQPLHLAEFAISLDLHSCCSLICTRHSSSRRWQARQTRDRFTKEAAVQGLKSRAAFKLLQIDAKYHIFQGGQTVVDLGYAPGSWSQVAIARTRPNGRVLGVDIIPAQPPKGLSTIQGNFLDPTIQAYVQDFVRHPERGRVGSTDPSWHMLPDMKSPVDTVSNVIPKQAHEKDHQDCAERTVDVVLSDMSAPWPRTIGFWKRSLSDPYIRMMNTSGVSFRDHAGSMDLCNAALQFAFSVLKVGGHFVCKFYQGAEDKQLEKQLKTLFQKVHRLKPESSRNESKESFFIGIGRKESPKKDEVFTLP